MKALTAHQIVKGKLRVLFVPDSIYWITGRIARQITEHNPWIEPTICSYRVLRKLLKDNGGKFLGEIDLVHFLTPRIASEFIGNFRDNMPCITTIHHVEDEWSTEAEPRADAVMTVCRQWHEHLILIGVDPAKIVKVSNGVRSELFRPPHFGEQAELRRHLGLAPHDFIVGFSSKRTSNSYNRKGIEILTAAMVELRKRISNAAFVIIGPGWTDFVDQQRQLGTRCVYLPFVLDYEKLAPIYRTFDAYWVTARIEGGPVPLLEAMSSGVACVTTRVGVALEVVQDRENAIFAGFEDVHAFAEETEKLAVYPEARRKIGEAARQSILNDYESTKTSKSARELYTTALDAFRRRQPNTSIRNVPDNSDSIAGRNGSGEFLHSIPLTLRSKVSKGENLIAIRDLIDLGANEAAYGLNKRELLQRPLDLETWHLMVSLSSLGPLFKSLGSSYRDSKKLAKQLFTHGRFR